MLWQGRTQAHGPHTRTWVARTQAARQPTSSPSRAACLNGRRGKSCTIPVLIARRGRSSRKKARRRRKLFTAGAILTPISCGAVTAVASNLSVARAAKKRIDRAVSRRTSARCAAYAVVRSFRCLFAPLPLRPSTLPWPAGRAQRLYCRAALTVTPLCAQERRNASISLPAARVRRVARHAQTVRALVICPSRQAARSAMPRSAHADAYMCAGAPKSPVKLPTA